MRPAVAILVVLLIGSTVRAQDLQADASVGLKKAVTFFHRDVASHGGYLWKYSADLKLREAEGKASTTTVWVQPPGTPAVGLALLEAYARTGEPYLLAAATDAGRALVQGQMHSGGWSQAVYFDPATRTKSAYRVDGPPAKKARNISSFDDEQTQSALRFLAKLDAALGLKDAPIHEATQFGLAAVLAAQHRNGGWAQVFDSPVPQTADPTRRASISTDWPRKYPGGDYWWHYTLNDGAMTDTIEMLLDVAAVYNEPKYRAAAVRGGEFILLAQLPEPQPAWAQQYDKDLHPAWARKFEPPAVSSAETQMVCQALLRLYRETGDERFLKPIEPAVAWLKRSTLPDGQLARFYELGTNKPLYMTRDYQLTFDDSDLPTHYAFKLKSKVVKIEQALQPARDKAVDKPKKPSADQVRKVLASMDERGAWVEPGTLRFHKVDTAIIDCQRFIDNVDLLSRYLARE
jgi:hypothetical protein